MNWLRRVMPALLVMAVLFLSYGCSSNDNDNDDASSSAPLTMTLMNVNDTHSQIEPLAGQSVKINDTTTYVDMAGMARLAAKVAEVRASHANTLLLHAGDAVQGTLYFTKYEGQAEFAFLNEIGVDAMTVGNHEFDKGPATLANFLGYAQFPIISANIDASADADLAGRIAPHTIATVGGQSIGIIGLTTPSTAAISSPGADITFEDAVSATNREVAELEGQGINKIIVLSHLGYDGDKALAQAVSGVDIIVGGHSHTLLGGQGLVDLGLTPQGDYPSVENNPQGEPVYIVQSWEKAKALGLLDVSFDAAGKVTAISGQPVLLTGDNFQQKDANGNKVDVDDATRTAILAAIDANDSIDSLDEDPAALALLDNYKPGVDAMQTEVIAKAGDNLYHTRIPFTDQLNSGVPFPFGSYIAPHVAESMLWKVNQGGTKNADLALKGGGGVRINVPAGDISVGEAYELLPFANTLVVVELTGAEVKEAIQSGVTSAVSGLSTGAYPYVAGARYTVDALTNPQPPVVTSVEIKNDDDSYSAIDESGTYHIVVDSYVAGGGDYYSVIGDATGYRYDTGFVDVEAFMDYAQAQGTLYRLDDNGVTYETAAKVIRVIETTDLHGSFFPYDFIEATDTNHSLAQVSSYVEAERAVANQSVVLLDDGDTLQGQPIVNYYNYEHTPLSDHVAPAVMNYMGYDAATVGNHDIEPGKPVYDAVNAAMNFPWLAANCVDTTTGQPYFQPYTVVNKDGIKIAILGLITPAIPSWLPASVWPDMRFDDMWQSAQTWMDQIQTTEQPDVIIGLFHSGWDYCYNHECTTQEEIDAAYNLEGNENGSQIVANEVDGFDLVLTGHDHASRADSLVNRAGHTVYYMGARNAANAFGEAIIVVNTDGSKQIEVLNRDATRFPVDTELYNAFSTQVDATKTFVDEQIGSFASATSSRDAMFGDSSFNDLIHKLQFQVANDVIGIPADVSIAAPLQFDKTIDAGPVYVRDLYKLYQYDNWMYVMQLTGTQIDGLLEYSYAKWTNQMISADDHLINFTSLDESVTPPSYTTATRYYNYDSAAGIVYTVDVSKPAYDRVTILGLDADLDGVVDTGSTWSATATYNVAINSYRAGGGGGHLTDPNGANIDKSLLESLTIGKTARDLRYYLGEEIKAQGTVTPAAIGNWKFIPETWADAGATRDRAILYPAP